MYFIDLVKLMNLLAILKIIVKFSSFCIAQRDVKRRMIANLLKLIINYVLKWGPLMGGGSYISLERFKILIAASSVL